jgi:hypothetical protein
MQPDEIPIEPAPTQPALRGRLSGGRRLATTAVFAVGLLTIGGVATVLAASPSPSTSAGASTAPSASQAPSASCPARPSGSSSGSSS